MRILKRKFVTKEFFAYAKSVIDKNNGLDYKSLATLLTCSSPTVRRIYDAKTFEAFKSEAKIRSRAANNARTDTKITPRIPEAKLQMPSENQPVNLLVMAVNKLSISIVAQTMAVEDNTKAYKNLRDRMAVANQLKARELHNLSKEQLSKYPATEQVKKK